MLRRRPAFAVSAIVLFALCLGANLALISVANGMLRQPLPGFPHLERLVAIWSTRADTDRYPFTLAEFLDYRRQTRTLDQVAAFATTTGSLRTEHGSERLGGLTVSANFFELAHVNPRLGRMPQARDEARGAPRVIVLSYRLWTRVFASRSDVIGKKITLNGQEHVVVGVLPSGFLFPNANPEFLVPLAADCDPMHTSHVATNYLRLFGHIPPGTTIEQVRQDLGGIANRLRQEFPESNSEKLGVRIVPLRDQMMGPWRANLTIAVSAALLILLVATLNMAGVFAVQALRSGNDLEVLTALGTGPRDLFWHILTQSTALCLTAGVIGAGLAQWWAPKVAGFIPSFVARPEHIGLDASVLLAAVLLSLLCGLIFGAPAALQALKLPRSGVLQRKNLVTEPEHDDGARRMLVMAEVAFCLVVVIGAGLLLRSFLRLESVNPGFKTSNLLTFRLSLPPSKYPERRDVVEVHDRLLATLRQIPGVTAAQASSLPLNGFSGLVDLSVLDSRKTARVLDAPYVVADESYFQTIGISILAGRGLAVSDSDSAMPVAVISRNLADRLPKAKNPVGMHLLIDDDAGHPRELTIVGVVSDVRDEDLEKKPSGAIYVPIRQVPQSFAFFFLNNTDWVIRTPGPPMDLATAVRDRVANAAPEGGIAKMQPMEAYLDMALQARLFSLRAIGLFACGVLVLAALGLYALMSHSVYRRTREIGVRVVLGARSRQIVLAVIGEGITLACAGIGIGLGAMFVLARILSTMLFEVPVYDPVTIVGAMILMIVVAVLATSVPAHRATKLDPILALRQK